MLLSRPFLDKAATVPPFTELKYLTCFNDRKLLDLNLPDAIFVLFFKFCIVLLVDL